MQVASVGLVKAIDRFDPARGTAFSTYAVPTILGELKRYFRDSGWAVHVPRGMQERVMKLDTAAQELHRKLGRSPSPKELASQLELLRGGGAGGDGGRLRLRRGLARAAALGPRQGSTDTFQDTLGTEEERYELVEYGATIAPTLKALSPRERLILHLRFVEDMTQSEIADRIGVSQMHVSRLIRRSLARLRTCDVGLERACSRRAAAPKLERRCPPATKTPPRAAARPARLARRLPVQGRRRPRALRRQGEVDPQAGRLALLEPATRTAEEFLVSVESIDFVATANEAEALLAEQNFIKRYRPPYNIRLRDDKSYPYIGISLDERFPRVYFTRERHRAERVYFGPFSSAKRVRETLDLLGKLFPTGPATGRARPGLRQPCLDYYIKRCQAPCVDYISEEDYRANIDAIIGFLSGRYRAIERELEERHAGGGGGQEFERAAAFRTACARCARCSSASASRTSRSARST